MSKYRIIRLANCRYVAQKQINLLGLKFWKNIVTYRRDASFPYSTYAREEEYVCQHDAEKLVESLIEKCMCCPEVVKEYES